MGEGVEAFLRGEGPQLDGSIGGGREDLQRDSRQQRRGMGSKASTHPFSIISQQHSSHVVLATDSGQDDHSSRSIV